MALNRVGGFDNVSNESEAPAWVDEGADDVDEAVTAASTSGNTALPEPSVTTPELPISDNEVVRNKAREALVSLESLDAINILEGHKTVVARLCREAEDLLKELEDVIPL